MRPIKPLLVVTIIFFALTAHCATGGVPSEYNPAGQYSSGASYTVSLPSIFGKAAKPSVFSGTFKEYVNPFTGEKFMIPEQGEYSDPRGFRFVGVFDYIPRRIDLKSNMTVELSRRMQTSAGGSFVFAGDRFDDLAEDDEEPLLSGIFVSQVEAPLSEEAFTLAEATPEYVEKLSSSYRESVVIERRHIAVLKANAARGERQIGDDAERGDQGISSFLNLASNLLGAFGKMPNVGGNLGSIGTVAGNFTSKMEMAEMALKAVKGIVTEDQSVGDVLAGAVGDKMKSLLKRAGGGKSDLLIDALDKIMADGKAGAGKAINGKGGSPTSIITDAFGTAVINHTTNVMESAFAGNRNTAGLGRLSTNLLKQTIASHTQESISTSSEPPTTASDDPGAVQLPYPPRPAPPSVPSPNPGKRAKQVPVLTGPAPLDSSYIGQVVHPANFDALGRDLPKTESYTFVCGGHTGVETMASEAPDNCIAQYKLYKTIQCYPGAALNKLYIDLLKCGEEKSTGIPKAAYRDQLEGAKSEIRRWAAECTDEIGCRDKVRLGNI